ncbi:type I-B CRISPR-associated protein Cas8b/Csh1 [Clostridium botulinum]|uniref:hypothetical protein n=1 Tax=Clostridium botulinum TaxID=1491 RepID=UPI00036685A1|nr:hypothetical protein [Clostridium botulinum]MBN1037103.1 type I-B CRISPR-associated protein Cas8b/Csh1 [Clostridium botulinum]
MLKDCLEVFTKIPEQTRERMIIDGYIPVDGTYILLCPKGDSFEIKDSIDIKLDKKKGEIEGKSNSNFNNICFYDYNSKLVEMNKPIDKNKIIHSNNYLSFFVKKDSLSNGKLTNEIIDNYYSILENPYLKYKELVDKKIYESIENEIGKVNIERLEKIKSWIKENIFKLDEEFTKGKGYLKIFFEYSEDEYKNEGKRYFIPNIYNSNKFNKEIGKKIYGVPNDNMGLNSKKPYLENKSRKFKVPYLIDNSEVLLQKQFFDYLLNFATLGKLNIIINENDKEKIRGYKNDELSKHDYDGIFLRLKKGKEVEIHDYDIITGFKTKLPKKLHFKNIIGLDLESKNVSFKNYQDIIFIEDFQKILNDVFYSKLLINNYFTEPKDISTNDSCLKNNLLLSRESIFNYIHKGSNNGVFNVLNKISLNLIKGDINNGYAVKASHKLNLRWSIMEFEEGIDMAEILNKTIECVRNKINVDSYKAIETDDEYYFSVGQIVSYFLSKYKGKNKPLSLGKPFINVKSNEIIRDNLRKMFNKYSYDPSINSKRFKNLYVLVNGYIPEGKVDEDMIIAGFLSNNLIYESSKEESK